MTPEFHCGDPLLKSKLVDISCRKCSATEFHYHVGSATEFRRFRHLLTLVCVNCNYTAAFIHIDKLEIPEDGWAVIPNMYP